jgi:predicted dehydrogenase
MKSASVSLHESRASVIAPDGPVGVAIIGLGYWGPNLLRVLADNPDAQVRWICDLDRERLRRAKRRYPSAKTATKVERVLSDPAVEAVLIATPVRTHHALAAQALQAGKHVFASGLIANVELSWLAPSKLRRTVIVGSERMVTYDDGAVESVRVFDSGVVYRDPETFGEYHLSYRSGDIVSPKIESHEPLSLELGDFIGAVRSGETMEFHTALARSVVRIVEAADRSLIEGREIAIEPPESLDQLRFGRALALA